MRKAKPDKKSCLLKPAQYQWTILISLVLLFSFFTAPCYARWSWGSKEHGIIKGSVTDSQTDNPVSGVKVCLVSLIDKLTASTVTDREGSYKLSNLSGSRYSLEASKQGYESQSKTVFLKKNETCTFDFRLVFGDIIPPKGTIKINSNRSYTNTTNVTLNLSAQDNADGSGLFEMKFSNDSQNWSNPEAYAATRIWTLTTSTGTSHFRKNRAASSTKTAYVKFSDKAGNWSPAFSDTIILDTAPPAGSIKINSGSQYTNLTSVSLNLSATDSGSGLDKMQFSNDGSTWSSPEAYAAAGIRALSSDNGEKRVYVKFSDKAGNWSNSLRDTIILDTISPEIEFLSPLEGSIVTGSED